MSKSSDPKSGYQSRRRIAKGPPRPEYLASADLDRMMIMFVALTSEMLTMRDRLDTHEVLLERDGALTKASIEAFRPDLALEEAREEQRLATMRRIFRVLRDEFETYDEEVAAESGPAQAA